MERIDFRKVILVGYIAVVIVTICTSVYCNSNVLFSGLFLVWISCLYFSFRKMQNRFFFFLFITAFFTFVMGRDVIQQFSSTEYNGFAQSIENGAFFEELLSLSVLFASYCFFSNYENGRQIGKLEQNIRYYGRRDQNLDILTDISRKVFFICIILSIIYELISIKHVYEVGYAGSYVNKISFNGGMELILSKVNAGMSAAFYVFLATLPSKKEIKRPLILYIVYLILSLGTGHRSALVLGSLFLIIYFIFRNKIDGAWTWFKKKYIIVGVFLIPVALVFFYLYNYYRFGITSISSGFSFGDGVRGFFFDQGVTGKVIKYGRLYKDELTTSKLYTGGFYRCGFMAKLLDIQVYHGNSLENAFLAGDFAHAISYRILGDAYLSGRGSGSSYIAELYQDFGYIGIIIGSTIFGYLFSKIDNAEKSSNWFTLMIRFIFIPSLLWAPRGAFSGFIQDLISPSVVLVIIGIYTLYRIEKMYEL